MQTRSRTRMYSPSRPSSPTTPQYSPLDDNRIPDSKIRCKDGLRRRLKSNEPPTSRKCFTNKTTKTYKKMDATPYSYEVCQGPPFCKPGIPRAYNRKREKNSPRIQRNCSPGRRSPVGVKANGTLKRSYCYDSSKTIGLKHVADASWTDCRYPNNCQEFA